jgi:D-alanyl-D-alanine carboxypeptidase
MKKHSYVVISSLLIFSWIVFGCKKIDLSNSTIQCNSSAPTFNYSKSAELQTIINKYATLGIPGISVAIKTSSEEWCGVAGYSKIETQTPMQICNLQYAQSIVKTYTAVLVMKLYEEGKIDLEIPINKYLPSNIADHITNSNRITVKMLLNHTSGIFDYAYDYTYSANLLSKQDKIFNYLDLISVAYDKKSQFEPGSQYSYCNTNFLLLAIMVNEVTGKDHSIMMTDVIFKPLGLTNTYYKNEPGYLNYPELVNCYLNRTSDNRIENVSKTQVNNVTAMIGDDGIVATPMDYTHFLHGLAHGQLLQKQSLDLMMNWVLNKKGDPAYGLGLTYRKHNTHWGFGHGGSGIGAGGILYYFPDKDVTIFVGVNFGTLLDGPFNDLYEQMKVELLNVVLDQ